MKKLFIISVILLVVVLFFLGIYNFAFKKSDAVTVQSTANQQTSAASATNVSSAASNVQTQPPTVAKQNKIKAISSRKVIGATFDKKNNAITYYSLQDGTVWQMDQTGSNEKQISAQTLSGLKNVTWSADHSKVLTTLNKNGQDNFFEYDYKTQKATPLKSGLDSVAWDNLGAKIFYKYFDAKTKSRSLNIANPDGSGWQKLADISARNLSIAPIPLSATVSYWNSPDANEQTQLQTVAVVGGDAKTIFTGKFGADYLWSPDGSQALISSVASKGGNNIDLGIVLANGTYRDLNISTLVSKCVWSADNKNIYCALPTAIPDGAVMPNDYQNNKFTTKDTFWKIDTTTGQQTKIVGADQLTENYDASNPFLSAAEDTLYFVNRLDQKIYMISL